jgi:hypothetical protein
MVDFIYEGQKNQGIIANQMHICKIEIKKVRFKPLAHFVVRFIRHSL